MDSMACNSNQKAQHTPVLIDTIINNIQPRGIWIDGTFGAGGYSRALLESGAIKVFGVDKDPNAIKLSQAMSKEFLERFSFFLGKFSDIEQYVDKDIVDGVVFDLGVSSMQLDHAVRGFSFRHDGPLDMRMGEGDLSAADIVNGFDEEEIADILFQYGEEKSSRIIAKKIVSARPIMSTLSLSAIINSCFNDRVTTKIHPATKSFQALRIAVNDELAELVRGLEAAERILKPGGELVVVTFHSLEDRIVKKFLRSRAIGKGNVNRYLPSSEEVPPSFILKSSKPYLVGDNERQSNPRSRSAKLRIAVRTDAAPFPPKRKKLGLPKLALESLIL